MEEKKIPYVEEEYDVVVVGAGHAGCEAKIGVCKTRTGNNYFYRECRQYSDDAV